MTQLQKMALGHRVIKKNCTSIQTFGSASLFYPEPVEDFEPDGREKAPGEQGFTLLELMVVVAILAVLALMIVPRVMERPDQARVVRVKQDIRVIEGAIKLYRLDNLNYPTTGQGLMALVEKPTNEPQPRNWSKGGYLDRLPKDPWGNVYIYLQPGAHGDYDIFTLGADGKKGGDDIAADIGNWNLE